MGSTARRITLSFISIENSEEATDEEVVQEAFALLGIDNLEHPSDFDWMLHWKLISVEDVDDTGAQRDVDTHEQSERDKSILEAAREYFKGKG